jgi:FkbM family methyltransferase
VNLEFWSRTLSIRARRRLNPETTISIGHRRVKVDLRDGVIASKLYMERTWEPELGNLFRRLPLRDTVCVDVGANLGLHTLELSECVGRNGKVLAYEPDPHNFSLLTENIRLNQATNVVAERIAIGEGDGEGLLRHNSWNFGDHRLEADAAPGERYDSVTIRTLDSATASIAAGKMGLIKVDTQGYDFFVLKGMTKTLERNPQVVLVVEICADLLNKAGTSATELVTRLRELGFDGWELHEHRFFPLLAPGNYEYMDAHEEVNVVLSRNPASLLPLLRDLY